MHYFALFTFELKMTILLIPPGEEEEKGQEKEEGVMLYIASLNFSSSQPLAWSNPWKLRVKIRLCSSYTMALPDIYEVKVSTATRQLIT